MLPTELLRVRVDGPRLSPSLVDPEKPAIREIADEVHGAFARASARGARLGEALDEIDELCAGRRDAKLIRGLAKLAQDRCTSAVAAPIDPVALRLDVFRRAARVGPLALRPGPFGHPVAADLLAEVGREHDLSPDAVADALYADLPVERRLSAYDVPDATWLVHRYNVALVQGLLLRATEVDLVLERPRAPRMRQLFRWVKFHQLLHRAWRDGDHLRVRLDGPVSLFAGSTRYGLQLARFLPALLLQDGGWELRATLLWTRARHRKELVLGPASGLRSHYRDDGAWQGKTQEHLIARFAEHSGPWRLVEGARPLTVGDRDVVFPDFTVTDGHRELHVEILGFWRPDALAARLEALERFGPQNLVLAVSRKLGTAKAAAVPDSPRVVGFADLLPVPKLVEAAERLASES